MTKKKKSSKTKDTGHKAHSKTQQTVQKAHWAHYAWPVVAVFMTVVFLIVVANRPDCSEENDLTGKTVNEDEFMFVKSDACNEACTEAEPMAKELAETAELDFRKVTTPQEIPVPGYMIITDKETKMLMRPIENEASFYEEACQETENEEICEEAEKIAGEQEAQKQEESKQNLADIPEKDQPTVDLYVMSFCPYGNKAEDTISPVYELLKDKVDFDVHYIVSVDGDNIESLHGTPEVEQNKREVCVKENYGMDKFLEFVTYVNENCGGDGECWEDGAQEAGLDVSEIEQCADERGVELMKEEAEKSEEAGATGSPTMLINDQKTDMVYNYGQPNSYLDAICAGFSSEPAECQEQIETTGSDEAAGSDVAAGNC
ncbi:MAG: hypothetical protein ACOCZ6_02520 [Nanoarchaeota archaeon]